MAIKGTAYYLISHREQVIQMIEDANISVKNLWETQIRQRLIEIYQTIRYDQHQYNLSTEVSVLDVQLRFWFND